MGFNLWGFSAGLPVVVVGVTLATSFNKYVADNHCWLNIQTNVIWAFVGPVLFILIVSAKSCREGVIPACLVLGERCLQGRQHFSSSGACSQGSECLLLLQENFDYALYILSQHK